MDDMWCSVAYESLQDRKEIRDNAWRRPGWDDVVANTGPFLFTALIYVQIIQC